MAFTMSLLFAIVLQVFLSSVALHPSPNESNNPVLECRTERQTYLPLEQYKLDVCARCYNYMPLVVFRIKFKYNSYSGDLLDPSTNITHLADPFNSSRVLLESFRGESLSAKWKTCCKAAWACCDEMSKSPKRTIDGVHCPRTWDGWQCWPDTLAGTTASQPCQEHIYFEQSFPSCTRFSYKECLSNGTWFLKENFQEWTNYSPCGARKEHRRYLHYHTATFIISIVAIVPALIIFVMYKQLQVHRISMHKNLFMSLLLNGIATVSFKIFVMMDDLNRKYVNDSSILTSNGSGCKILLILTRYFRMTNYMWMFCEGYYLHKLIAAAFAEQKTLLLFYAIGWGFPALPVSIYAVLRATMENEKYETL